MATSTTALPRNLPRMLKAAYLANNEELLRETRSTGLFYFPGPILWLLIVLGFTYSVAAATYPSWPAFPGLTAAWSAHLTSGQLHDLFLIAIVLVLAVILWLLVRYLRWMSTVYAVTTSRVIVQSGIFGRDFDEIPVGQVRGVDVHQTVGQRMLGYGTVRVSSEGGTKLGNEDWKGIPRPFEFQRLIEGATQSLGK